MNPFIPLPMVALEPPFRYLQWKLPSPRLKMLRAMFLFKQALQGFRANVQHQRQRHQRLRQQKRVQTFRTG